MEEPNSLDVNEHIRLALSETHPEVSRFTYPLFAVDHRDRPDLFASSVLIECDGTPILVTAAHAIHEIGKAGSTVHVGATNIVPLEPEFVLSSPRGNDPLDIAAMVLPQELIATEAMSVLPQARTIIGRTFRNYHFRCVHGYPCNKNKQSSRIDLAAKRFTKYGFTYAGASRNISANYSKYGKDPNVHAVLEYQDLGWSETGKKVSPPHPKGISGGGAWIVPDSFAADAVYLDGIAIEYYKQESLVFSTRIEQVFWFVREHILRKREV